jgi:pyruvate-formate lyase-activating enzyme
MRVSIISPDKDNYNAYYRQKTYEFDDVKKSLKTAFSLGVYTYINLLTIPGFTDREDEVYKLINFVKETKVRHIQIRNLNIDPDYLLNNMPVNKEKVLGILNFLEVLQKELPETIIGNYSVPIK